MNQVMEMLQGMIDKPMGPEAPPFNRWLGGTLRKVQEGSITLDFVVRREMTNPAGVLHGGIQAAFIDDLMGMTATALDEEHYYISLNLHVDYLGRALVGETITATSSIIRRGKQIINAQCELFNAQGELISRGVSNLIKSNIIKEF